MAAYGYAAIEGGYAVERSSFSRYRSFSRDAMSKQAGDRYETDVEFADDADGVLLHIEVKTWPEEVDRIAAQIDEMGELQGLPETAVKELEYVLDLVPRYLWIVGPGTVDPPTHVFGVEVYEKNARFRRLDRLPTRV